MVGIPGAGKTFFAEHFASTFKAPIVNQSRLQKTLFGEVNNSPKEVEATDRAAQTLLNETMKTGATIVYDGPTSSRAQRTEITELSRKSGYTPIFVWVQTDTVEAERRATNRKKDDGFLTRDEFNIDIKRFTAPGGHEKAVVISGKHTYASQLKIVLKTLAETREPAEDGASYRLGRIANLGGRKSAPRRRVMG